MYHSVTFGSMNSFSDWHLVPESRPVIIMPDVKEVVVEVPGANGILDLSETLSGYPTYKNRLGSLKFHVLNDIEPWQRLYARIAKYLHGKRTTIVLEDDPQYYYQGRTSIIWTSNNDGTWSDVEVKYDLDPYKYFYQTSVEEDPETYKDIVINNTAKTIKLANEPSIGSIPVVPEFIVTNIAQTGASISFMNTELNIDKTVSLSSNGTKKYNDMVISNISGGNVCNVTFDGGCTVNIVFRRMEL